MCDKCTDLLAENQTHDISLTNQEYGRIIAKSTVFAWKEIGVAATELTTLSHTNVIFKEVA